jgi:hypothetical protein
MTRKLTSLVFIFCILFSDKAALAEDNKAKFIILDPIIDDGQKVNLEILDRSLIQTNHSIKITTKINLKGITNELPARYSINLYKKPSNEKQYLSRVNLTVLNKKQAKKSLINFEFDYFPNANEEEFYIDIYNENLDLISSYKQAIEFADELVGLDSGSDGLTEYECDGTDGKCLLDYIVGNIKFFSSLEPSVQTQIIKESDQPYKIITPILRKKRLKVARKSGSNIINLKSNFFDNLFIGNNDNRFGLNYSDSKLNFSFNNVNTLSLDSEGKLGNVVLEQTNATDLPEIPGKLEYDGNFLYFTDQNSRKRVFLGTPSSGSGNLGTNPTLTGTATMANDIVVNETLAFDSLTNNPSGAAVTINWHNGNRQSLTLNQPTTINFSAPPGVAHLTLMLIQDAIGGRTVTWPSSVRWSNNTAPSLTSTSNQIDIITCFYTGSLYYCQAGLNFSP